VENAATVAPVPSTSGALKTIRYYYVG